MKIWRKSTGDERLARIGIVPATARLTRKCGEGVVTLRHARNKTFHHRDISEKAAIVTITEDLLDLIGMHLKTLYEDAAHVAVSPYQFLRQSASSHHYALSITRYSFTVTAYFGEKAAEVSSEGTCSGDAIARYLHSLKASRVGDLHQLQSKLLTTV